MRRFVLFTVVALLALTEACAVGPRYRRSSLGLPDGWRRPAVSEDSLRSFYDSLRTSRDTLLPAGADTARVPFAYDTAPPAPRMDSTAALRWLDLIQDSVLRQLVDTSLRANRDMRTALAVIDEFRAQYRATRGALLPELTANGQAGRNQTVFGTFGSFTYNVYQATANLSWELDVWGRLRRATSAARSDLVAREEDRRALQLSLIGDVATAYFDLAADLNLAIARRTLDSRRQTLALARRRLDQGLISELDVRQFEAEVASPAASVADFERQVAQQENALSVLVGHNPGAIARGRALTEMAARIPVPAGVPSALLGNRPDVRGAEATLRAATARIGVAQAAFLPTFTITGQYGTQSTEFSQWFASGTNIWQAFAGVSIPLFTEGRPGAGEQVNIAQARASQARSRYEQTVLVALREVEDALVGLRTAQDRTGAQERQVIALRRALELADMRYRNGVSSYLDVLDAQRGLFGAELGLTQAERDQLVAAVQLYRAVGAGWPAAKQ